MLKADKLRNEIAALDDKKKDLEKQLNRLRKLKCNLPDKLKQSFAKEFKVLAIGKQVDLNMQPNFKVPIVIQWRTDNEAEYHLPNDVIDIFHDSWLKTIEDQVHKLAKSFVKDETVKVKDFCKRFDEACKNLKLDKHEEWESFYEEFNLCKYGDF